MEKHFFKQKNSFRTSVWYANKHLSVKYGHIITNYAMGMMTTLVIWFESMNIHICLVIPRIFIHVMSYSKLVFYVRTFFRDGKKTFCQMIHFLWHFLRTAWGERWGWEAVVPRRAWPYRSGLRDGGSCSLGCTTPALTSCRTARTGQGFRSGRCLLKSRWIPLHGQPSDHVSGQFPGVPFRPLLFSTFRCHGLAVAE